MKKSKYVQDWMPINDSLNQFYKEIDDFVEDNLNAKDVDPPYLASKIIADPLLGYIHFTGLEVLIIDTPLYQRLRNVKQLGLANLVFPSLGYSRFEHSLGVVGRMNQILIRLKENYLRAHDDDRINKIIDKYSMSIRLAALLHDIGHCLFSHCSERVINKLPGTTNHPSSSEIRKIFTDHFGKNKLIPFAEIFSISIIGNKKFLNYIMQSDLLTENKFKEQLHWTSRFILGLPILDDPHSLFISQLMSGGIDADKLDYMTREQLYSGIKLEIDLDRILSKLEVFEINSYQMPANLEYIKLFFPGAAKYSILGFSKGGQFAFEEFCIARLALHVKVYLHQKVRAAESQIENYLNYLTQLEEFKKPAKWLNLPEDIINYPSLILNDSKRQLDLFSEPSSVVIDPQNFYAIKHRKLFVRAFAFGPINSLSENNKNIPEQNIEKYFQEFDISLLKNAIVKNAIEIAKILKSGIKENNFDEFIIDKPRILNIQQGQESLYFERANYSLVKWTIPIDKIMVYFQENRALAYVFAPLEISPIISLATEKVLLEINHKIFDQDSYISKSVFVKLTDLKQSLTMKGFYNGLPQLKGISKYLQSAMASEKIKQIYENLASFKSLEDQRITLSTILTFCNQFPVDDEINLQDALLALLTKVKIYNESELNEEIEKIVKSIATTKKIGTAFLGSTTDSGSKLGYHLRTTFEKYNIAQPSAITDSLVMDYDCLLIFDDNINSGLQLINIMGELLDEKEKIPVKLDEEHIKPLKSIEAKEKIKNMEIYFAYIVGFEKTEAFVKEQLSNIFGFNPERIHFYINTLFKENEKVFAGGNSNYNHEFKKELREYLEGIGEQLLKTEGKDDKKIGTCKLGYGSAEALVLFPYNVPTMTITALWCTGKLVDGTPWIPLASRRRRRKNNGDLAGED